MRFTLAREELCEDRTGEGRVIELDREIGAVVLGGFRPGGADFGLADEDAVAWRVAAGIGVGDDAYRLGLHRKGDDLALIFAGGGLRRSEEHTSELQSLMRISYAVFCLKQKTTQYS